MSATFKTLAAGAVVRHVVAPGDKLSFAFSLENASVERVDNDLVLSPESGGKLVLSEFFVVGEGNALPTLVLADGAEIESEALLKALAPDMDISTAAGNTGNTGGGSGEYDGNAGDMADGLDRMGSLGTTYWSGARGGSPLPEAEDSPLADGTAGFGAQPPSVEPAQPTVTPPVVTPPVVTPPVVPPPFTLSFAGESAVYESGLPGGSAEASGKAEARGAFVLANPKGALTVAVSGQTVDLDRLAQGYAQQISDPDAPGTLTLTGYNAGTGEIVYVYSLDSTLDHAAPGDADGRDLVLPGGSYAVSATDASGKVLSGTLNITVRDDEPNAHDDFITINKSTLTGLEAADPSHNLLGNDLSSADGQSIVGLSFDSAAQPHVRDITQQPDGSWLVETDYGVFTVNPDGSYVFDPGSDFAALSGSAKISFSYSLRDGDGDESSAEVTLNMYNQGTPGTNAAPQIITDTFASSDIVTATGSVNGTYNMYSKVAALENGNYVVAWKNGTSLYTQMYNPLGQALGEPVAVSSGNAMNSHYQYDYSDSFTISSTPSGGYLVTWDAANRATAYGQEYDDSGNKVGGAMNMAISNSYGLNSTSQYNWPGTTEYSASRDTLALENGGYVIIGHDNDGNYFNCNVAFVDANGNPVRYTTDTSNGNQTGPVFNMHGGSGHDFNGRVIELGADRIVVVYIHSSSSGSTLGGTGLEGSAYIDQHGKGTSHMYMGIYSIERDAEGNIIHIGTDKASTQMTRQGSNKMPEICELDGGRFAVVWQEQSGPASKVQVQVFEKDGNPALGFETPQAVSDAPGYQLVPTIAGLPDGGYVVVWTQEERAGGKTYDILARRYDANGNPTDEPISVAQGVESYELEGSEGTQRHPDVTVLADGRLVITWTTMATLNGKAEVHHQIIHPKVFGGESESVTYVSGQESINPLETAIAGMYDTDGDKPGEILVQIANAKAGDLLALDSDWCAANGINVQLNSGGTALILTLSGSQLSADDQWSLISQALKKISYENTSPASQVTGGERLISVVATDEKGAVSSAEARFEVIINNDAPELAFSGEDHATVAMNEALALMGPGQVSITDKEYDDIAKATVSIANYLPGDEELRLELPVGDERFAGITASFDPASGVLTITGAASASVYQQVLGWVRYECTSDVPVPEDRVITVRVSDAGGLRTDSEPVTITVTAEHPTAPLIKASPDPDAMGDRDFGEGSAPVAVALHDGGFALCAKTASGLEVKIFNANGEERGVSFTLDGADSVRAMALGADGSLLVSGVSGGQSVLLQVLSDGSTRSWNCGIGEVTDLETLPGGGCMIAGVQDGRVVCQTLGADGTPGALRDVAESAASGNAEIAVLASGAFALVYEGAGGATQVSFFNASGAQLASAQLPSELVTSGTHVDICALDNGQYVLVWRSSDVPSDAPYASETLRGQVFNANGYAVGGEFVIDQTAYIAHSSVSVTALEDGRFAVSWSGDNSSSPGQSDVFVNIWDAEGNYHTGGNVPEAPVGASGVPSVSSLAGGGFVVAWQKGGSVEYHVFNDDGSSREPSHYVSNNGSVGLFHDVSITDPDGSNIMHALVSIDGFKSGDELFLDGFDASLHGLQVSWNQSNGTLLISGSAPTGVYEQALESLCYRNGGDTGVEGVRGINVVLTDDSSGSYDSNTLSTVIEVHDANAAISGDNWANTLYGTVGNDIIQGNYGNDALYGGLGDDLLLGGAGNDILVGGAGNDILTGGSGQNTFVWQAGDADLGAVARDVITDFNVQQDTIDLSQLLDHFAASPDADRNGMVEIQESAGSSDAVINVHGGEGGPLVQQIVLQDALNGTSLEELQAQINLVISS